MTKPPLEPVFTAPSALIAFGPFRYVWNNLPSSLAGHIGLVLFAMLLAYFAITLGLTWIFTICWRRWRSN